MRLIRHYFDVRGNIVLMDKTIDTMVTTDMRYIDNVY